MATHSTLAYYMSNLNLSAQIRYIREGFYCTASGSELVLYSARFKSCPSHINLVCAVENKLSRSTSIRKAGILVPLCITLICSKLYSVNTSVFEDINDLTIEFCWEYIELISISVYSELQKWMINCMEGRKCTG